MALGEYLSLPGMERRRQRREDRRDARAEFSENLAAETDPANRLSMYLSGKDRRLPGLARMFRTASFGEGDTFADRVGSGSKAVDAFMMQDAAQKRAEAIERERVGGEIEAYIDPENALFLVDDETAQLRKEDVERTRAGLEGAQGEMAQELGLSTAAGRDYIDRSTQLLQSREQMRPERVAGMQKGLRDYLVAQRKAELEGPAAIDPFKVLGLEKDMANEYQKRINDASIVVDKFNDIVSMLGDQQPDGSFKINFSEGGPFQDIAAIKNFNLALEPTSIVREGEFAATVQAQGYIDQLRAALGKVRGDGLMSPQTRQEIVEAMSALANMANGRIQDERGKFGQRAADYAQRVPGFNPRNVFLTRDRGVLKYQADPAAQEAETQKPPLARLDDQVLRKLLLSKTKGDLARQEMLRRGHTAEEIEFYVEEQRMGAQ